VNGYAELGDLSRTSQDVLLEHCSVAKAISLFVLDVSAMTIYRRLMNDLFLLVLLTGGTILAATWISEAKTIERLSTALIDRTARHTEEELHRFFGTVRANVLSARDWAAAGILDATDHTAMNKLFVPVLQQHPQISSMMVANSDGAEYLLLRDPLDPSRWSNRVVQADRWGTRVLNRSWNTVSGEVEESYGELEYDPRKRIWYQRALDTTAQEPVYWTQPVIFFVTKDPGVTASTHWTSGDAQPQTTVVAFDLLLMDISKFTSTLEISERGMAIVLVEDRDTGAFKVVGLPRDTKYATDSAIRSALVFVPAASAVADSDAQLPPPDSLKIPAVTRAMDAWRDRGRSSRPARFSSSGEKWWGGWRSFALGENTFWIGVVVPERDLSAGIRQQQVVLLAIVLGVLIVGMVRASILSRRFSTPIEQLVTESERISDGQLDPGQTIESDIDEIRRLALAHEQMREGVQAAIKLQKLERDLDIAREIQRGLLPSDSPQTPGFEVAGWNRPADKTGGDYFDWLTLPDGRTLFTLADVTGHGIGPALLVAVYRAYMRAATVDRRVELAQVVSRINDLLCADIPDERFITAAFGVIRPAEYLVELLSAGQAPLFFYDSASESVQIWDADDLPLGIADQIEFDGVREIHFAPGDILALMTDGFFEATNAEDQQFGIHNIEQFILGHHHLPPDAFIRSLYQQVKTHVAGEPQGDDLTALIVKRSETPPR
jgi:serine phosphatase RsbU (regulator of sigma subunit)